MTCIGLGRLAVVWVPALGCKHDGRAGGLAVAPMRLADAEPAARAPLSKGELAASELFAARWRGKMGRRRARGVRRVQEMDGALDFDAPALEKAKKDAEHLKAKKAHESRLKECEVAMNAVKDAMKDAMKAECSKLNLAEKDSSWRGLHPPSGD